MFFTYLTINVSSLFAEAQLFEADGYCIMGDIGIENTAVAQNTAKERALRAASEQANKPLFLLKLYLR